MKKILLFFMVSLLTIIFIGCTPDVEYTFEVEADETTVQVGETINIFAETNKPSPVFVWTSSDDAIATVNEVGMVKGISEGVVTITVALEEVGEKEVEITVTEKDLTAAELKTFLTAVLSEYTNAKNGYIKLTSNGSEENSSETMFNYALDGSIESLMYKAVTEEGPTSVYVKDGYSYMSVNGAKEKKVLTAQDQTTIKTKYGHVEFLSDFTRFYAENEFYTALDFSKKTNDSVEFLLDLSKYTGTILKTEGVDEFKIITTIVNNKVTKVEISSKQGETTFNLIAEYLGTGVQTINYPADLDTYIG